jgi:hypothetical protein
LIVAFAIVKAQDVDGQPEVQGNPEAEDSKLTNLS